ICVVSAIPCSTTWEEELNMADASPDRGTYLNLLCALSFASDIGMGQPMEHGLKAAYIGVRIADRVGLPAEERAAIYGGALLKDAGCTSHAVRFASLFVGNELAPRHDFFLVNPESMTQVVGWFMRHATADASLPTRMSRLFSFFVDGGALL